jgi:hypothetical protein
MVGLAIAVPSAVLQFAILFQDHPPALRLLPSVGIANLVLLVALVAVAADYPLAGRQGRAALIGLGVALVMPGPTAVDSVVMLSAPPAILVPYVFLLAMLACAEAGLYLLATRPSATIR